VKPDDPSQPRLGSDPLSANFQFIAATADQEPILANLLELYAYDFSEFADVDLKADGKFSCFPDLSAYWREPDHYPVLISVNGNLAGLVLLKRGSEFSGRAEVWDMDDEVGPPRKISTTYADYRPS
jgi:hypothetical protein